MKYLKEGKLSNIIISAIKKHTSTLSFSYSIFSGQFFIIGGLSSGTILPLAQLTAIKWNLRRKVDSR